MKKMNKKGFTLIELLAVIIILGVLMIIAIPSVTQYIQNSRKSAMVDTASSFIDGVRTKVNEASDLKFFDTDTLYLVPVGEDDNTKWGSCISLEKGGSSPFGSWVEAYVGVTYDGTGYNYYFYGRDDSNQGINFVSQKGLADDGSDLVESGNKMVKWDAATCPTTDGSGNKIECKNESKTVLTSLGNEKITKVVLADCGGTPKTNS